MLQQHEILAIVRPSVRDQWPVRHAADVKSDRWRQPWPHKWRGPPTSMCVRKRGCGPRHTPGGPLPFMVAAATEQLHWLSQLVITAALRLDRSSPERVPGNLFPGN